MGAFRCSVVCCLHSRQQGVFTDTRMTVKARVERRREQQQRRHPRPSYSSQSVPILQLQSAVSTSDSLIDAENRSPAERMGGQRVNSIF